jgi:hypothetical protein
MKLNKGKWDSRQETIKNLRNEILLLSKQNETKFRCFCCFAKQAKQFFCLGLFRVSRNKKIVWVEYYVAESIFEKETMMVGELSQYAKVSFYLRQNLFFTKLSRKWVIRYYTRMLTVPNLTLRAERGDVIVVSCLEHVIWRVWSEGHTVNQLDLHFQSITRGPTLKMSCIVQ